MNDKQTLRVEIYSDPICPWCFIGKRRFERAAESRPEVELQVTWMPFQLNPDMPAEGMDRQSYLTQKFGGAERAAGVYAPIVDAGAGCGIQFNFDAIATTPNTLRSHRLIHFAATEPHKQDGVVEALFERYFLLGENIGELSVLEACATQAGLDGAAVGYYLRGSEDEPKVEAQDLMARQMGIQGVPFFVFERKYALSGAQSPDVMGGVIDQVCEELSAAVE